MWYLYTRDRFAVEILFGQDTTFYRRIQMGWFENKITLQHFHFSFFVENTCDIWIFDQTIHPTPNAKHKKLQFTQRTSLFSVIFDSQKIRDETDACHMYFTFARNNQQIIAFTQFASKNEPISMISFVVLLPEKPADRS